MRNALMFAAFAMLTATPLLDARALSPAQAEECAGSNCPPAEGTGIHDCEHKKQEQTTS